VSVTYGLNPLGSLINTRDAFVRGRMGADEMGHEAADEHELVAEALGFRPRRWAVRERLVSASARFGCDAKCSIISVGEQLGGLACGARTNAFHYRKVIRVGRAHHFQEISAVLRHDCITPIQ
jgi:hypothetical protein